MFPKYTVQENIKTLNSPFTENTLEGVISLAKCAASGKVRICPAMLRALVMGHRFDGADATLSRSAPDHVVGAVAKVVGYDVEKKSRHRLDSGFWTVCSLCCRTGVIAMVLCTVIRASCFS